jgi:hypothetical protein
MNRGRLRTFREIGGFPEKSDEAAIQCDRSKKQKDGPLGPPPCV